MNAIARTGVLVLMFMGAAGLIGLSGRVINKTTTIVHWQPNTPIVMLDTGNRSVTRAEAMNISLVSAREYDWTVNVNAGRVAVTLFNNGRVAWSFDLSNTTFWTTQGTITVGRVGESDYLGLVRSAGPGSIDFAFYPSTTGVYQFVAENHQSGNVPCVEVCHGLAMGGLSPRPSVYSVRVTAMVPATPTNTQ